jgi:CDP-diacylglycerol---glycerol-3-phosphate 3-phosphatidyltransferase
MERGSMTRAELTDRVVSAMAKIFSNTGRAVLGHVVDPIARSLLRLGVTPNMVTVAGTVGVVLGSIILGARGYLVAGALVVTFFALTDMLDGTMARMRPTGSKFGALLDSSMDRIADGAVFGAVIFYLYGQDNPYNGIVAGLISLGAGQVVSYVKARAQSLGLNGDVGIAERLERLIIVGVGGIVTGLGADWGLPAALWLLAVLSVITIFQRLIHAARTERVPAE